MNRPPVSDLVSIILRVALGGVMLVAGALKLPDPAGSVRAVRAYDLLSESLVPAVGYALPMVEVVLGLLLILGLLTRAAALGTALLQGAFIVGIASAWARGLEIDCGCFGGGGEEEGASAAYPFDIARDVGFILAAAWVIHRPVAWSGLDRFLSVPPPARDTAASVEIAESTEPDRGGR